MKNSKVYLLLLILLLLLPSCERTKEENRISSEEDLINKIGINNQVVPSFDKSKITVWSYDSQIELFDANLIGNIPIEYNKQVDYPLGFVTGITSSNPPDVLIVDNKDFGLFNDINVLTDYASFDDFATFKEALPYSMPVESGYSLDQTKVYGMLVYYSPYVMAYRADHLQDYGIIQDLESSDCSWTLDTKIYKKWMVEAKKEDRYLIQWSEGIYREIGDNKNYFNSDYSELFPKEQYEDIYELNTFVNDHLNEYHLGVSIWTENGYKAIREEKYDALYMGSWLSGWFKENVPEIEGKYRLAPLPFGQQELDGSMVLIHKDSPYKKILYNQVKKIVRYEADGYYNNRGYKDTFFGNQNTGQLVLDILMNWKVDHHTSLDQYIDSIYNDLMSEAYNQEMDFDSFQESVLEKLREEHGAEMRAILNVSK